MPSIDAVKINWQKPRKFLSGKEINNFNEFYLWHSHILSTPTKRTDARPRTPIWIHVCQRDPEDPCRGRAIA